jgi:hypothetical protein
VLEGSTAAQPGVKYPRCLEGARACPPEDVGGVAGYEELLEALSDPKHERHEAAVEHAGSIQPEQFDVAIATRRMKEGVPNW